ncbi:hypothetical protein [Microseira sp. BLCC-F43]
MFLKTVAAVLANPRYQFQLVNVDTLMAEADEILRTKQTWGFAKA